MWCFWCFVSWQNREIEREGIRAAATVYDGKAVCISHLNERRGLPPDAHWRYDDEDQVIS